jgi:hypothetical protein
MQYCVGIRVKDCSFEHLVFFDEYNKLSSLLQFSTIDIKRCILRRSVAYTVILTNKIWAFKLIIRKVSTK